MSSCESTCWPGPRPIWSIPDVSGGPVKQIWVDPANLCTPGGSPCGPSCEFKVGPETPGLFAISATVNVTTSLPYEIIATGKKPATAAPTGKSFIDFLGYATELVGQAASRKGIRHGLCVETLRPPCSCGCTQCVCGVRIDRSWLPSDTYEVLGVKIDGIPVPEYVSGGTITAITVAPDPLKGTVTYTSNTVTFTPVTGFEGEAKFQYTYVDQDGHAIIQNATAYIGSTQIPFSTIHAAGGLVDQYVTFPMGQRRQWRIDEALDGKWLVRLDPSSSCTHKPGSCGCSDGERPMWQWPRSQRIDLPETMECTWSIRILRGCPVPQVAQDAVVEVACDMVKACVGQECALPENIASLARGGVVLSYRGIQELQRSQGDLATYKSFRRYVDYYGCRKPLSWVDLVGGSNGYDAPFPTRIG